MEINLKTIDEFFDRVQLVVSHILRFSIFLALGYFLLKGNWELAFLCFVGGSLSFLPAMIERNYKIMLPLELEFLFAVFIYGSIFLGEVFGYYNKFWWWDIFLHSLASIILGIIGFVILYVLQAQKLLKANFFVIVMFSFCFAVALGAVWELFEYFMDSAFGFNMMKEGLVDTMQDLISDCLGALLVSVLGYFYLRHRDAWMIKEMVVKFVKENPQLISKKRK